jgi:hypothetical protein
MIKEIIFQWDTNKGKLEEHFKQGHPGSYINIVKDIFEYVINNGDDFSSYDTEKLTVIDDGDYQGTQIFIIPKKTYQPDIEDYLITDTYYGSCSGCDTLQSITQYYGGLPTEEQVKDYMTLALHLVQKLRHLNEYEEKEEPRNLSGS